MTKWIDTGLPYDVGWRDGGTDAGDACGTGTGRSVCVKHKKTRLVERKFSVF